MIIDNGSFRDPSGFIFGLDGKILRQINKFGSQNYELLMSTGLYQSLTDRNLLVKHKEVDSGFGSGINLYKVIEPDKIRFISYPFEWSFNQLRDAALLTLEIQKISLSYNMVLKDATNYNIQFENGRAIFIDTLSFEKYEEGFPWVAYKQFCEHFLAPLVLMKYTDIRLNGMLRMFIDGIPLDLTSNILPKKTKLIPTIAFHIHSHAMSQKKYENIASDYKKLSSGRLPKNSLINLITSLELYIKDICIDKNMDTEWGDYYSNTNYSDKSFNDKKSIVGRYLDIVKPKTLWDFGANTGVFSRLASDRGIFTIAFDIDPIAVNKNYNYVKINKEKNIFPLILDLNNPSPNMGWNNEERKSFKDRGLPDVTMALALIHHMAISNNLPFIKIVEFFSALSPYLIIEFVPKDDSQVKKLLASREDIFDLYNILEFERVLLNFFEIIEKNNVDDTLRTLYLLKRKGD